MSEVLFIDKSDCMRCSRFSNAMSGYGLNFKDKSTGEKSIIKIKVKEYDCGPEVNHNCPASKFRVVVGVDAVNVANRIAVAESVNDPVELAALFAEVAEYEPEVRELVFKALNDSRQALKDYVSSFENDSEESVENISEVENIEESSVVELDEAINVEPASSEELEEDTAFLDEEEQAPVPPVLIKKEEPKKTATPVKKTLVKKSSSTSNTTNTKSKA